MDFLSSARQVFSSWSSPSKANSRTTTVQDRIETETPNQAELSHSSSASSLSNGSTKDKVFPLTSPTLRYNPADIEVIDSPSKRVRLNHHEHELMEYIETKKPRSFYEFSTDWSTYLGTSKEIRDIVSYERIENFLLTEEGSLKYPQSAYIVKKEHNASNAFRQLTPNQQTWLDDALMKGINSKESLRSHLDSYSKIEQEKILNLFSLHLSCIPFELNLAAMLIKQESKPTTKIKG